MPARAAATLNPGTPNAAASHHGNAVEARCGIAGPKHELGVIHDLPQADGAVGPTRDSPLAHKRINRMDRCLVTIPRVNIPGEFSTRTVS